ncbi:MAG TPA: glycogen debranching N-terminal domain-containing protein, partial [Verrucomicrobiae bacterium]
MRHRRPERTPEQEKAVKNRVLTQGIPSVTSSTAEAVVMKDDDLFFLCQPDSRVPLTGGHGFGLYFHDCRYLRGYELKLLRDHPIPLGAAVERGPLCLFELTNPELHLADGSVIHEHQIGIQWQRLVCAEQLEMTELISFSNFSNNPTELPVSLAYSCAFEDVFSVRGLLSEKLGKVQKPSFRDGVLTFFYEGSDELNRCLLIQFSEAPESVEEGVAQFKFKIKPRSQAELKVVLRLSESAEGAAALPNANERAFDFPALRKRLAEKNDQCVAQYAQIKSSTLLVNKVFRRSL